MANKQNDTPTGINALAVKEVELAKNTAPEKPLEGIVEKDTGEGTTTPPQGTPPADTSYTPPVVEEVGQPAPSTTSESNTPPAASQEAEKPLPGPDAKTEQTDGQATLTADSEKVNGEDMVSANGTVVTNIMMTRIQKHLKHLRGELGFANTAEQAKEQTSFIETIGNSTTLDYDDFKLVTDALVRIIIDNKELFRSGAAYRFIPQLSGKYPQEYINRYERYMNFLVTVATNWTTRNRLQNSIDIAYVITDLRKLGKENVTKYFTSIVNARQ